uniref:Uncharacterized protein n=1 Tax=Rhizophora mucronata TaxID=61149 RepID=A0A2P2J3A6_RHIMU
MGSGVVWIILVLMMRQLIRILR